MYLWQPFVALLSLLVITSCATQPTIPPPPEEPATVFDDPTCISCGYLLEEPELSKIRHSANNWDPEAAFRLSLHYSSADSRSESEAWMQRAAELGHPTAQYNMWFRLRDAEDCADRAAALAWLEKSSGQGYETAMSEIEAYRAKTEGCPRLRPNYSFKPTSLRDAA